eukprot:CAMPEP_0113567260 /NCGR_PEP_ID=MMETSP0015_2-20120614/23176_1 /TAXON_ID=2838 /ORGANISM="Odontella" /LENGTH=140 /DNA_ID=CAMNT_0000469633 /DNA_START=467 /DNA_END=889 /DNA_ORIENTATION=- /assembly_acc=CAM_ASM_000160
MSPPLVGGGVLPLGKLLHLGPLAPLLLSHRRCRRRVVVVVKEEEVGPAPDGAGGGGGDGGRAAAEPLQLEVGRAHGRVVRLLARSKIAHSSLAIIVLLVMAVDGNAPERLEAASPPRQDFALAVLVIVTGNSIIGHCGHK